MALCFKAVALLAWLLLCALLERGARNVRNEARNAALIFECALFLLEKKARRGELSCSMSAAASSTSTASLLRLVRQFNSLITDHPKSPRQLTEKIVARKQILHRPAYHYF